MSYSESCVNVWDWLCGLRLEQYSEAFQNAGLATLQQCHSLSIDQLEQMGINLPGHQRRILASLSKTQGNRDIQSDTYSRRAQCDRDQRLEEKSHTQLLQREQPVPTLLEEKPVPKQRKGDSLKPIPRERERPIPRERQVSRMKEAGGGPGEEKKTPHEQRQMAPRLGKEEERNGGVHEERKKPVPKERTTFRQGSPGDCPSLLLVSSTSDTSLPPVPPRSSPNCPPQCFTSALSPSPSTQIPSSPKMDRNVVKAPTVQSRTVPESSPITTTTTHTPTPVRPQTLAIQPLAHSFSNDNGRKTSPIFPTASPSEDRYLPPLPPKIGVGLKSPLPVPQYVSVHSPSSQSPPFTKKVDDETLEQQTPQIPPRIRKPQIQDNPKQSTQVDTQPALPARRVPQLPSDLRLDSLDNSDEYEDPDLFCPVVHCMNQPDRSMSLNVPNLKERKNSLYSDDEFLDGDDPVQWPDEGINSQGSVYLPNTGRQAAATKEGCSQLVSVIKSGWLEKNPPQGGIYYQKRWVKLDADYLRYFNNDKDVYSKGLISTAFITNVTPVGELKFEVATNNRIFAFKAESEAERNEWVVVLQDCTRGRNHCSSSMNPGSPLTPNFQGFLELKGLRSKLYTVVASDKVFLYKNIEDYRIGIGITSIEMNVGNIKDTNRRSFYLTTPYRTFSFIAESEQLKGQWVDAMRSAIGEALSNSEVADQIWAEPSNSLCADCGTLKPEWAAVNLCVVICKQCAGEHRGLGPSISKVRSLKMDRKVWTEELIKLFLLLGNEHVNSFWAANVPPSEALTPSSSSEERRRFITNKYRQGKYRKYHPLYGNQTELNNALCISVQCSDVLETLRLIFCGADVNCSTGMTAWPTPLSLANEHSQPLQAELISQNLNTELPRLDVGENMETKHYSLPPCVSYNGFLFKTASMARAPERKAKEEFSRRWCTLNDGTFSYYESDKNSNPNGALKSSEITCLAVDPTGKHGYENTFELYSEAERLYLFGTDEPDSYKEWVKSIAKSFSPAIAEPLLRLNFERIGRLKYKDGLNLQTSKVGWFALVGSTLHVYLEHSQGEEIRLRKLNELSIQQDNGVLVLVEKGRTLYIEGERRLDFAGWCAAIQAAAGSGGDTLSQQQLTETDIPIIVHSCIDYITQCGLLSEGIYRKSGVNSRVAALCDRFRHDARSLCLKEVEHQVDDVSNSLKRFFRELKEGLFTSEDASTWLSTTGIQEESVKIDQYKLLLSRLPHVNKATLQALINHLYCVQRFSDKNQMNIHNLAIVFGPTLFQTDGKDYTAGRAVEDLIQHYTTIFEVEEQQLQKQLDEINLIQFMREKLAHTKFPSTEPGGHFICTVYLEEKKEDAEQHVKIPGSMTAAELTCEVLDKRNISVKDKDYWTCWEISDKEEMERPLHYQERVLPILHSLGTDSHLLIKKHHAMDVITNYLVNKGDPSKHGLIKFREERNILGLGNFHDRYFILNSTSLRMYKDVRSNRPERDWPVKNLMVYLGIKRKVRPPTCWGLTVIYESKKQDKPDKQQWYLCHETQSEMREWYATFLSIQSDGNVWPQDGIQQTRASRVLPESRHGNVSLIPLRGSENEMRNSVAAFSQDLLAMCRDIR